MSRKRTIRPSLVMERIEELMSERVKRGYPPLKLSAETGITRETLRDYENGVVMPGKVNYNKLA